MSTAPLDTDPEALARHGITRIATERFEVNGFRYDRLSDAMAEAKRGAPAVDPAR